MRKIGHTRQKRKISIILIFLALCGVFMYQRMSANIVSDPAHIDFTASPLVTDAPFKVRDPVVDPSEVHTASGKPGPCQPKFFDPRTSKFSKEKQIGTPTELYVIEATSEDDFGGAMMIDGWQKEGENKILLPEPFSVTTYNFGCASSFSHALDITKNGVRHALYTHVLHFDFSDDGKYLYLVNSIQKNGEWVPHTRIIHLETKVAYEVPRTDCVSDFDGFWQGNHFISFAEKQGNTGHNTSICVWDATAKRTAHLDANVNWMGASRNVLIEQIGLLPNEPSTFYAYTTRNNGMCSLFLVDTTKNESVRAFDIFNPEGSDRAFYCYDPKVEFDFSSLTFERGSFRYRIEKFDQMYPETRWDEWITRAFQ